ncbi:MAG: amidohydrolase [Eubacteriales bacterium]|nr:amidohydrolase [Eubacteriales bacterium]
MTTLIENAHILTMDNRREIPNGCVLVDDGKIAYVGRRTELPQRAAPDAVLDGKGGILLPGFVNAHTHLAMTLLRGYGSDLNLQDWLTKKIFPAEDRLQTGDCATAARVGIAECLLGGTTTFSDMYMFMDETARVVRESGIRAVLCRGMTAGDGFEERLADATRLYRDYHGHADGRISVMLCIHAEYTNTEHTVRRIVDEAGRLSAGIHVHLAETRAEVDGCRQRYGVTPAQWMDNLGVFARPVTAAHTVWLSDGDIQILAEKGVHAVHNPASNMKLASGVAPVQRMLDAGVNVALGTDGASSNNTLNMLRETQLAALLGKLSAMDPTAVDAYTALQMATLGGARALGLGDVCGSIEVGKDADLILLDTSKPWWAPRHEAAAQIVYAASTEDITMTMVRGRILMQNRQVKTIDVPAAMEQMQTVTQHLY